MPEPRTNRISAEQRGLPPGARGRRLADAPTVSLVVSSYGPREALACCLDVLLPQCEERGVELVVARSCSREEYQALATAYPSVLFMPAATGSTPAQLRAVGASAAEGDVVWVTDDGVVHAPDFVACRLGSWPPEPL